MPSPSLHRVWSFWALTWAVLQLLAACSSSPREFSGTRNGGAKSSGGSSHQAGEQSGRDTSTSSGAGGDGDTGSTAGPCNAGEVAPCWETPEGIPLEGDPESLSGNCRAGVRSCSNEGAWGACDGAIAPAMEDDCTPGD